MDLSLFYVIEGPNVLNNVSKKSNKKSQTSLKIVQIAFLKQDLTDEYMEPLGILVLQLPINVKKTLNFNYIVTENKKI